MKSLKCAEASQTRHRKDFSASCNRLQATEKLFRLPTGSPGTSLVSRVEDPAPLVSSSKGAPPR
jgi:hypothetical protein